MTALDEPRAAAGSTGRGFVSACTVVAIGIGAVSLLSAVVLTHTYRPAADGWAMRISIAFGWAALLAAVVACVFARRRRVVSRAAVGAIAGLATSFTQGLVRWDQLALWRVTVGKNIQGYWPAAFDKDVRFVLVGGSEVSQTTYRIALLAHLGAAVVALVALAMLFRTLRPVATSGS